VPIAYLHDAQQSLARVISLAASTGLSPTRSRFDPVADSGPHRIKGPFLAMDVALKDVESEVKVEMGRLYLAHGPERPLMDVAGLQRAGIVEVVKQGGHSGALYRTVGRDGPAPERPFQLSQGNVAVITAQGLRAEINTWDPTGQAVLGEGRPAMAAGRYGWAAWSAGLLMLAGASGGGWYWWRRRRAGARP